MPDGLSISIAQEHPIRLEVELTVAAGQTLALVGPSGAGKTTILRSIAGLHRPPRGCISSDGTVWLNRKEGIEVPPQLRRVGFVFQSYALFPHLSAARNVAEAMMEVDPIERRARAAQLLDQVHLSGFAERKPHQLSGGQQQRVALARALARDPRVLLLDEPFSAVDHPTKRSLHELLAEIRRSSTMPIILVSHNIEDVCEIADRVCFIRAGASEEIGATRVLLENPASKVGAWLNSLS